MAIPEVFVYSDTCSSNFLFLFPSGIYNVCFCCFVLIECFMKSEMLDIRNTGISPGETNTELSTPSVFWSFQFIFPSELFVNGRGMVFVSARTFQGNVLEWPRGPTRNCRSGIDRVCQARLPAIRTTGIKLATSLHLGGQSERARFCTFQGPTFRIQK